MNINSFIANTPVIESLCDSISESRLSHGIIISGKKGCGVNFLARLLAADIIGADENAIELISTDCHPLVQTIQGSGVAGQIKVSEIRNINENVNFSSLGGERRVVIIKNCENFNLNSANALLKNLEEPKDDITYILTTNDVSRLLTTIRSRCSVYTLTSPTKQDCEKYFATAKDKDTLSQLIDVYSGNIGLVKNALNSPKRLEILQKAIVSADNIYKKDKYKLAANLFAFNKKKDDFKFFLNDIAYICQNNIDSVAVSILNAAHKATLAIEKNANLSLIIQNFIIDV